MFQHRVVGMVIAFAAVNLSYSAQAQIAAPGSPPVPASGAATGVTVPASKENITVIGRSPVPGATRDQNTLPTKSYKLTPADIDRTGIPNLTGAMLDNIPGVTINETEGNVFQPDILFRGFTASPVAGTSEGLAVYLNGARFNEAFADTVNWDLITPIAINSVNVEAANPVFGLNALGGSVDVRLKNGFNFQGADLTAYGGSYGRGAGIFEYGQQSGDVALYVAGDITHDDGFRETSASDLYRINGDLGWRHDGTELHLNVIADHDTLGNPGASPVQALNANIANIFTAPNEVYNHYYSFNLNGTHQINDDIAIQGVGYFQNLTQSIPNGTTAEVGPCDNGTGLLCNDDGTVVTGRDGTPVSDFLHGGVYSGLSTQGLNSNAYGASAQLTDDADLFDHANKFVLGSSFDGSDNLFTGNYANGGFNPYTREYIGPGVIQDQPSEEVNPVRVATVTRFYALFAQDVLTLAPGLDLNLAGRFNNGEVDLHDKLGGPVNGQNSYNRFNPNVGLSYQINQDLQIYASYAETNRVPTPLELSCASAANPCSLLSFFVGDPPLKQVVSHTVDAGLRGKLDDLGAGHLSWDADYYHTQNFDDLIYESTILNPNLAYYTNAGKTLRQGAEAELHYDLGPLHTSLGYAFTDATFQSNLLLSSLSPAANANGLISVTPGDRLPGIPEHRGTAVVKYDISDQWTAGLNAILQSSSYRFGDESNQTKPLGGYGVVNFNTSYKVTENITIFGIINNMFNERYDTYGGFAPVSAVPWPNVPGGVTDPRTASPGTPIAGYGGVRVTF